MNQKIRNNVFETNSSSCHTITLISKDEFEKFKTGKLYYAPNSAKKLMSQEEIMETDWFKHFCDEHRFVIEDASQDLVDDAFEEFMQENCDTDYAEYYTNYCDNTYVDCYDKDGNPIIAISFYTEG